MSFVQWYVNQVSLSLICDVCAISLSLSLSLSLSVSLSLSLSLSLCLCLSLSLSLTLSLVAFCDFCLGFSCEHAYIQFFDCLYTVLDTVDDREELGKKYVPLYMTLRVSESR